MKNRELLKYERARKRVKELKNWYWSIPVFSIGTLFMIGFSYFLWMEKAPNFIIGLMLLGPVLWWSFFLVKWASLFGKKPIILKKWFRMILFYVVLTVLVVVMIYFMKANNFPEFMIYIFMVFPFIFLLLSLIQGILAGTIKSKLLKNWEAREIQKQLDR